MRVIVWWYIKKQHNVNVQKRRRRNISTFHNKRTLSTLEQPEAPSDERVSRFGPHCAAVMHVPDLPRNEQVRGPDGGAGVLGGAMKTHTCFFLQKKKIVWIYVVLLYTGK